MPSAMSYIPPTDKGRKRFNEAINAEYSKRKAQYTTALDYYNGEDDDPFSASRDDPEYDPDVDNTIMGLVKQAADRTATFLFPEVPKVLIDPDVIEETEEEKWVRKDFLEGNGGLHLLNKWALRGFLAGHTWLWIKNRKPVPKLVLLHPLSVTAFWRADDVGEIVWYEHRFLAQGTLYIRDFVRVNESRWNIILYKAQAGSISREDEIINAIGNRGNTDATYTFDNVAFGAGFEVVETSAHENKNGVVIPPILDTPHLPNPDSYYGLGEFTNKSLLDIINRVASERTRIIRQNADPVDVVTGVQPDEISGEGNLVTISSDKAKVTRLTLSSDLLAVNTTLDHLIEQFLGGMRVVILKGEAKDLQRVTNAAVRTLFLDALAKNAILWSSYKRTLAMACKLALIMAYANRTLPESNPDTLEVDLMMPSPLPVDKSEIANINALALNGGYRSKRKASTELGDDYNTEVDAIEKEFEQSLTRQKQTMELAASFTEDKEDEGGEPTSQQMGG